MNTYPALSGKRQAGKRFALMMTVRRPELKQISNNGMKNACLLWGFGSL
jgi:hypothetical protein